MILDPITLRPDNTLREADDLMAKYRISGVPITTDDGTLVGILTNRDVRFEEIDNRPISEIMTKENLITVAVGTTLDEAKRMLSRYRVEKLPIVDDNYHLKGLITVKDIQKKVQFPNAAKDSYGRLRVGAAVGVGKDMTERVAALVKASVDVVILDSSHGHSKGVLRACRELRDTFPNLSLIAGNVATGEGALALIKAGADGIRIGVGPGSICTTRVIAGIGVPQVTAVMEAASVAARHDIPVIADGGIKYSGDVVKAIAAGASTVMIGSLFAGTDESPGEMVIYQGERFKEYRGMGSIGAMRDGARDRYFQSATAATAKLVPEGIEGRVGYRGHLHSVVFQLIGGLRQGMGYTGSKNIAELQTNTRFMQITAASLKESHPHDVVITKEAPNYEVRQRD